MIDPKFVVGYLEWILDVLVRSDASHRYGEFMRSNVAVIVLCLDETERKKWDLSSTGLRTSPELPLLSQ